MSGYIYEEKIFSRLNAGIFSVIVGLLLFVLIYQLLVEPVGTNPAPNSILFFLILLFSAVGINFSTLSIFIDYQKVSVGYGFIKTTFPRDQIEDCYQDQAKAILYGGWGIRFGRIKGNWRLIYNTPGTTRVVLVVKGKWYREFVFSTQNPQEVLNLIGRR